MKVMVMCTCPMCRHAAVDGGAAECDITRPPLPEHTRERENFYQSRLYLLLLLLVCSYLLNPHFSSFQFLSHPSRVSLNTTS